MNRVASPRPGIALLIGGAVLAAGGVVGAVVEWVRLTTRMAMPTLPVRTYSGYHFASPSLALSPAPLYVFVAVALVGVALVVVGAIRGKAARR